MPDDIFECVDPNGVPFSKTNNFVDKAWAMNKIKVLEEENARLREENNKMRAMHDEALLRALSVVATIRGRGDDE